MCTNFPYDVAAAALIVQEAGGVVTHADGRPLDDHPAIGSSRTHGLAVLGAASRELHGLLLDAVDRGIRRLADRERSRFLTGAVPPGRADRPYDRPMTVVLIVIGVLVVLFLLWLMLGYNGLVSRRNRVDGAWSQIDVQLKRRHDLIPNLVETVKGYAAHERGTFEAVTNARANAINAQGPEQQAQAENQLTGALKSLFAVAEAYPDLKANQNFLQLQEELTSTEDRIAYARQFYNDSVVTYNTKIQQFPTVILANTFNFEKRELFDAAPEDTEPVQVQF